MRAENSLSQAVPLPLAAANRGEQLLGKSLPALEQWFRSRALKSCHAKLLLRSVCQQGIIDFERMSFPGKTLKQCLKRDAELQLPHFISSERDADGTIKWLMQLESGGQVETVFIPQAQRGTLCISTQAGCSLNCSFCATGQQGLQRNLSSAEIFAQVWRAQEALGTYSSNPGKVGVITNIVLMGMGEPLLNFDNVATAVSLFVNHFGFGIPHRRVTLSTAGVVPAIPRVATAMDRISLAVSLHSANDRVRDQLVPINRKYPLKTLMEACRQYLQMMPGQRRNITFQYTLIDGINDSAAAADEVVQLLQEMPCKVNLIPFNPISGSDYRRPAPERIDQFIASLRLGGIRTLLRSTRGEQIDAACGQLVGDVQQRSRRRLSLQPELIAAH